MGLAFDHTNNQTPLDEDEKEGLLITTITTRGELDEFEQQNIEKAIVWTMQHKFKPGIIISEAFVKEVHKRMFADVWAWAGSFRKSGKNLGVDKWKIGIELKNLLDDTRYWITHGTYTPDEIAIRFKHRIVSIHCFPNGNGRHSRLMADIIIEKIFKLEVFSWGAAGSNKKGDPRIAYLNALKQADRGNFEPLLIFARS